MDREHQFARGGARDGAPGISDFIEDGADLGTGSASRRDSPAVCEQKR